MTEFGKAVKVVFPNVKERRLGKRGDTKYPFFVYFCLIVKRSNVLSSRVRVVTTVAVVCCFKVCLYCFDHLLCKNMNSYVRSTALQKDVFERVYGIRFSMCLSFVCTFLLCFCNFFLFLCLSLPISCYTVLCELK